MSGNAYLLAYTKILAYITANRKVKHNSYLLFIEYDFTHDDTEVGKFKSSE